MFSSVPCRGRQHPAGASFLMHAPPHGVAPSPAMGTAVQSVQVNRFLISEFPDLRFADLRDSGIKNS